MAGQIFIEANEVEIAGLPLGAMHLYLVFRDTNGAEYVIRSGPQRSYPFWFGDMQVEVNQPIAASLDARDDETPAERASTPLDFPGLSDDQAWAIMVRYARMIEQANYPYELLDENSNAFIGAMLAAAGGDPLAMLPADVSRSEATGVSSYRDILANVSPPTDGTVRGTLGNDQISGIQIDEVIRARGGRDTVWGARGDDRILGNAGDDQLFGQAGRDALYGGSGADLLDGGTGRNLLVGGTDADVFQFTQASTARIRDFEDGVDRIRLQDDVVPRFDELTITSFGTSDQHSRIAYEGVVIKLLNVSRALLDASDMDLALV